MKKIKTSKRAAVERQRRFECSNAYDYRWSNFSKIYRKTNPFCVECLKYGIYNQSNTQVDHIIPLEQRPDLKYDYDNMQTLCRSHHSVKTAKEKLNKS